MSAYVPRQNRDRTIKVRVTPTERARLRAFAEAHGMNESEVVRLGIHEIAKDCDRRPQMIELRREVIE